MPAVDGFAGSVGSVGSAGYAGSVGPAGSTGVHRLWRLASLDPLAPPDNRIGGRGAVGDNANEERKRLVQSVRLFVVDVVVFFIFSISIP